MGMDVCGNAPKNEKGDYFRNNVWWWRPLWNYCYEIAPDVLNEETYRAGQFNDGEGLDEAGSLMLARRLREELANGNTLAYEKRYMAELAQLPEETCEYCQGTGVRNDAVGQAHGMPERDNPHTGGKGWCNGCDGKGTVASFEASYPFSEENVLEFTEFLENCGGFGLY